jgi:hypothetical protein
MQTASGGSSGLPFLSSLVNPIQGYSRPFNSIQGFLEKKDRLFFVRR